MLQNMMGLGFDRTVRIISVILILVFGSLLIKAEFASSSTGTSKQPSVQQDMEELTRVDPGVKLKTWKRILFHHSGLTGVTINEVQMYHLNRKEQIPYHFIIRRDGFVMATQSWRSQEYCRQTNKPEYNEHFIGICMIGDFSRVENSPSETQMASLRKLVTFLMKKFGIKERYIWRRSELDDGVESPGKFFPWTSFLRSI